MGRLPDTFQIDKTTAELEEAWKAERQRDPASDKAIVKALFHVFKWRMLWRFVVHLVFHLLSMISPLLVIEFTQFVERDEATMLSEDYQRATLVACSIIGLEMLEHYGHALFD